jgi:energy-converting hydrogenase Eha subunit E
MGLRETIKILFAGAAAIVLGTISGVFVVCLLCV